MQSLCQVSLALILLLLLLPFTTISTEELEIDNPCLKFSASKRSYRVFPDPQNPNGYLNCDSEGRAVGVLCPVGFRFSAVQSACVPRYSSSDQDEVESNRLFSSYCKDGCVHGRCVFDPEEKCLCNPGYEGKRCDHRVDMCLREGYQQCGIRGICRNEYGTYICLCKNGKIGANCDEFAVENPCTPESLAKNMSHFPLHPVFDKRYIKCMAPYTFSAYECPDGERFDSHVGRCVELGSCSLTGCQNGGQCIEMPPIGHNMRTMELDKVKPHFSCRCKPGFTGSLCENKLDFCLTNPCKTGRCESGLFGAICVCPDKIINENCESDIENPCSESNNDEVFEVISRTRAHENAFIYCHSNGYASLIHCPQNTTFSKRSVSCDTDATRRLRKELELAKGTVFIWPEVYRQPTYEDNSLNNRLHTNMLKGGVEAVNPNMSPLHNKIPPLYTKDQSSNNNMMYPNRYAVQPNVISPTIFSKPQNPLPSHLTQMHLTNNAIPSNQKYYTTSDSRFLSAIPRSQSNDELNTNTEYSVQSKKYNDGGLKLNKMGFKSENTETYEDHIKQHTNNENINNPITASNYKLHGDVHIPNRNGDQISQQNVQYIPVANTLQNSDVFNRDRRSLEEWNNDPLEAVNKFKTAVGNNDRNGEGQWKEYKDQTSFINYYNSLQNKITQPLNEIADKISNFKSIDDKSQLSWNNEMKNSRNNDAFDFSPYKHSQYNNLNNVPSFEYGQQEYTPLKYNNDAWEQINSLDHQTPIQSYSSNKHLTLPNDQILANPHHMNTVNNQIYHDHLINQQIDHPMQAQNEITTSNLMNNMQFPIDSMYNTRGDNVEMLLNSLGKHPNYNNHRTFGTGGYAVNDNVYRSFPQNPPPATVHYNPTLTQFDYNQYPPNSYATSLMNLFNYFRSKRNPVVDSNDTNIATTEIHTKAQ